MRGSSRVALSRFEDYAMSKVQEEPSSRPIRVAIVEDDRATREGLGILIGGTPGYCCTGTFRSVEEALQSRGDEPPDVVLLDIHLPGMLGSDGVRALKQKHPSAEVVMLRSTPTTKKFSSRSATARAAPAPIQSNARDFRPDYDAFIAGAAHSQGIAWLQTGQRSPDCAAAATIDHQSLRADFRRIE